MRIQDLPEAEKPYERLEMHSASLLSDAELLAILLQSGTTEKSSVQLAQEVLLIDKEKQGISFLRTLQIEDLVKVKGIGKKKAIRIIAAIEIGKRAFEHKKQNKNSITSPEDAADILMDMLVDERQENLCVIALNTQNQVEKISTIAVGSSNSVSAAPREVFKDTVKLGASKVILAHNHPSGSPMPSDADVNFTKRMYKAGEMLGIDVLDHIVIGDHTYKSLKEMRKF